MSAKQTQITAGGGRDDDNAEESTQASGQVQINTEGVDSLLDEIDGLLENNAEEFVRSYVQKGGE
ncbi:ubiquitin-like protein Pup [Corynebacterium crudilactis]|uniref:Prokaryotic ubiquitin-like protein Pup n=1 Tax=Corynebacterium crudilactis TaxID=1652495 RepID=A0A172QXF7_9CORY|nr:ubiquitin-like protein Pup [Corynebacterium crudilactis]ANE05326.1 ubiquitin-like protein Pup [Corynebacterium crudilactis]